jgi:hypothetical protein
MLTSSPKLRPNASYMEVTYNPQLFFLNYRVAELIVIFFWSMLFNGFIF